MSEATNDLIRRFKAARRVGTPLVAIETPDPTATMGRLSNVLNGAPVIQWDLVRGVRARNEAGLRMLEELRVDGSNINSPTEFLTFALKVPEKTVLFMLNGHRYLTDQAPDVSQALWNLRDPFKSNTRMLVILHAGIILPGELRQDVLLLDEPLPKPDELGQIVRDVYTAAGVAGPEEKQLDRAVDALRGLAAFPAEQATAMAMTRQGVDLNDLWEKKRSQIEAVPGLSIWRGDDSLDNLGGLENAKSFFRRLLDGNGRPRLIVFLDEVEKAVGDSGERDGGVQKGMMGAILTHMEDTKATGSLLVGVPGAGKTQLVKCLGNYAGIPVMAFDLPGMKAGIVGESERQLRQALKIEKSFSDGSAVWIATSNNIAGLPPEFRARFKLPTFFFDRPTDAERDAIWPIYIREFNIQKQQRPNDRDWTGREIRACCENAWRLNCSLIEAAEYVVPVAVSAKEVIERLRKEASGRYINASAAGLYSYRPTDEAGGGRRAMLADE